MSKKNFPIIVHQDITGVYSASSPNFDQLHVVGDSFEDVISQAETELKKLAVSGEPEQVLNTSGLDLGPLDTVVFVAI